jgi:N-acetylneuraminic acid mutarotase
MKHKLLLFSKGILILALVLHFSSVVVKSQTIKGSWTSITSLPTARWFPGTTVHDGKIYVMGGNASSSTAPLDVVEVYDPNTDSWDTTTSMPSARAQVTTCTVNGKIYVIGGSSGPSEWTPVASVDIYDPATDTWSKGTDMPNPRTELGLVAVQDKIYAIGGITGVSAGSKSVDIYNTTTDTWSKGTDMPTARGTMPAVEWDNKIYVFGGSNGGASNWNNYNILEIYYIASDSWSSGPAMPEPRSHLTGCVLNNKIYTLGGSRIDRGFSYATMFSYDPKTASWEREPDMITAREAFKSVVVNGRIYAIGGTDYRNGLVAFSNSEVYDTVPKVFVSCSELRLPAKSDTLIGKLYVPNSGGLAFTYQINDTLYNGALFEVHGDSLVTVQDFCLDSDKEYQVEVLAISENNDSVRTVLTIRTYFQVDAVFTSPMGFLLKSSDKKVMLDVLSSKTPGYGFIANSDEIYENMKNSVEPFNDIDLIYTSHTHTCHFDAVLLYNTMIHNPNAIAVMSQDVKNAMNSYFTDHPELLDRVFAPEIAINSFIDTTMAGIKIRLTSIAHEGSSMLCINLILDSIQIVHFDDYNNLTLANYRTIGFTQRPTDVAFVGSFLLNGEQQMIKETYQPSDYIAVSHIASYSSTLYNDLVTKAEKLKALNYQINVLNWPMEMFSYRKTSNHMSMTLQNKAPQLNMTFKDVTVEKDQTSKISIPKTSFKDSDPGDNINYTFTISGKSLPDWATYDTISHNLLITPTVAKTYTVMITATDNHLSYSNTSFKLVVSEPESIDESLEENSAFKVYPNPAVSEINIESRGDKNCNYSINLYNIFGERIYSGSVCTQNKIIIDLSEFSESIMFLTITSEGATECHKIIRY